MNTHALPVVLKFRKSSAARWLSHLDVIRVLERAIRRAGLPIMYSQGFNPRPRMAFGPPLPLGATSDAEMIVLRLAQPMDPSELKERLNAQLPDGVEAIEARTVTDDRPALGPISGSSYTARAVCRAKDPAEAAAEAVREFMSRDEECVERSNKGFGRRVDIRPSVEVLEVLDCDGPIVSMRFGISHKARNAARPVEIMKALSKPGREFELVSLHRESLY